MATTAAKRQRAFLLAEAVRRDIRNNRDRQRARREASRGRDAARAMILAMRSKGDDGARKRDRLARQANYDANLQAKHRAS